MEKTYIDRISENLKELPILKGVLTEDWIALKISENRPLERIIWMLTSDKLNPSFHILNNLERNLKDISFDKLEHKKKENIINSLKSKSERDIIGVISEIDVYGFFIRNTISTTYEPNIENHKKKVDFSVVLDQEQILVEVSALNISEQDKEFNNPISEFTLKIRKIKAPFYISLGFKDNFGRSNVKELYDYSLKLIKDAKEIELEHPLPYITNIRLKNYPEHQGNVIVGTHHAGVRNDTIRVRKLLRREAGQLSKNHKNMLIVNLCNYADDIDLGNALLGDEQITLLIPNDPNNKDVKTYLTRDKNNRFLQNVFNRRVNLVIGYKHLFNSQKWVSFHNNPYKPFTEKEKEILSNILNKAK